MSVFYNTDLMGIKESLMSEIESIPFDYRQSIEAIQSGLTSFGLTPNQSKVYIHLAKHGRRTAPQISKAMKIPRTETYHLLKTLQSKGIITSTLGHPTKFEAMKFAEALVVLLNTEKERVSEMEIKKDELIETWKTIPEFGSSDAEKRENKFQVIQGKIPILNKFKALLEGSNGTIMMLGSEEDYLKLYHTDFPGYLKKTKAKLKILTTGPKGADFVFKGIPSDKIKQFKPDQQEDLCFMLNDNREGIFFIKNQDQTKDFVAVWTDSNTLISSLKMLFDLIWSRAYIMQTPTKKGKEKKSDFEHGVKEIEQEKRILEFLYERYPDLNPGDFR